MTDDMRLVYAQRIQQGDHIIGHVRQTARAVYRSGRVGFAETALIQGDAAVTRRHGQHGLFPKRGRSQIAVYEDDRRAALGAGKQYACLESC